MITVDRKLVDFIKKEFIFLKKEAVKDFTFAFIVTMFITLLIAVIFKISIITWFINIILTFFLLILVVLLVGLWDSYNEYRKEKK